MGYTIDAFNEQMQMEEMPYEIIDECHKMMKQLQPQTLKAVRSFLHGFINN